MRYLDHASTFNIAPEVSDVQTFGDVLSLGETLAASVAEGTGTALIGSDGEAIAIAAINDAAVIANLQGDMATFTEGNQFVLVDMGANALLTDTDNGNLNGGSLTATISSGFVAGFDRLGVLNSRSEIGFPNAQGSDFFVDGQRIGTINGYTGEDSANQGFTITFDSVEATLDRVQAIVRALFFDQVGDDAVAGIRGITVTLVDGDADTSSYTTGVNVIAVNDAPGGTDMTLALNEDGFRTLVTSDFGFVDPDMNSLTAVRITMLPGAGTLYLDTDGAGTGALGTAVTTGQLVSTADIDAGRLVFVPGANGNGAGYAAFTFQVQDNGGTADGGVDLDQSPNTATFDVAAVNDAPTATITPNAAVKVGSEFLVNTTIFNAQNDPTITSLASGGFVVSWTDSSGQGGDATNTGIKARIFDATGGKPGIEFLVNTTTMLAQNQPTITSLVSGGFVVSWADASGLGGDSSGSGIKAQIYNATGTRVGAEFLVNAETLNGQSAPTITSLASGGFVVSWTDNSGQGSDTSGSGIKAQIFDATGGKVGVEFLVNAQTLNGQSAPTITSLASGGFVVSWTDNSGQGSDTSGSGIKAQIVDATGGKVGVEFLVNSATLNVQSGPTITSLASGGFVVSWQDQSLQGGDASSAGVKAQIFDATGVKVGVEFLVNTTTQAAQGAPTITSLASGGFVVSWTDLSGLGGDASGGGIKAQLFDATGGKVGGEFLVNTATLNAQNAPTITSLASGGFAVSWVDNSLQGGDASSTSIKAQLFTPGFQATEQLALDLKGSLAVADIDGGTGSVTATLSTSYGVLTVAAGTSGAVVANSGTGSVTLTGTIAQINALLRTDTTSAVSYTADTDAPPATATLTLAVDDGGNTGSGGALTGSDSKTIYIASVNDAPSGTDTTLFLIEDGFRTLTTSDFGFTDVDGNSLRTVKIMTLPGGGTLYRDSDGAGTGGLGTAVTVGQSVSAADIDAGRLVFVPAANASGTGYASFTFQVQDNGGTANGGVDLDQSPNTITFDVAAVNDAPSATIMLPPVAAARVGGEISVNTATTGIQDEPTITSLASGGFVVSWTDGSQSGGDTSDNAVRAQIFDAAGVKVGGEFLVNTTTQAAQTAPTLTSLASGGFVVSWTDRSLQGGDTDATSIRAQIFDAAGVRVGGEFVVNTTTASDQIDAAITSLASGGFVVSWNDYSGQGGDASVGGIKAQIFDAAGTRVGAEFLVNTATSDSQQQPTITSLVSGGFVVSWFDRSLQGGDAAVSSIKAQIFDAAGAKVGAEFLVNTQTTGAQDQPTITSLASGGFVVGWTDLSGQGGDADGSAIKAQIFNAAGAKVGTEFLVNTTILNRQLQPAITSLASGGFVVSWSDPSGQGGDADGFGIKAQLFDAAGVKVGAEFLVNTATAGFQLRSTITPLASGGFAVSWSDASGDANDYGIKAQVFAAPGFRVTEDAALELKGSLAIADVDAGTAIVTATLSTSYGILAVAAGTSGATVSGSGTGNVTLTGTIAQINALLSTDGTSRVAFAANTDTPPASATLTLTVNDNGNTGPGGALTGSDSETIFITAVNDAPRGAFGIVGVNEDGFTTLTAREFGFTDPEGQSLLAVKITTLPDAGTLYLDPDGAGTGSLGTAVTAGQFVSAADLDAGRLVYVPGTDGNGDNYASFTFQVQDNGGTANGGNDLDPLPRTLRFDVTPVNDAPTFTAPPFAIARVSTDAAGAEANNGSTLPVFSPDGTKVAFASTANNLVAGDSNGTTDIFIKDLATGAVTRVSTDTAGVEGNRTSLAPVFSPDGTKVAFTSFADNLVAGDTNNATDIFVKDLTTGVVTRVSTDAAGAEASRFGSSTNPVFSADGTRIAFTSGATNLVAGDTNNATDIFVKVLASGAITRVSTDGASAQGNGPSSIPTLSPDGTKLAFVSNASNLVDGDTNNVTDIFVKDLANGAITRVSTGIASAQSDGGNATPVFSADGTKLAFTSVAGNLVDGDTNAATDIFVRDLTSGVVTRVSTSAAGAQANGTNFTPVFSPDGTRIAFASDATNLVPGDTNGRTDIFVKDLASGAITRVSTSAAGTEGNNASVTPVFSPDGTKVAFTSGAFDLVAGDTNNQQDIFVATLGNVGTPTFTENGAAVALASVVNAADLDSADYAGGTLAVALTAGAAAGDVLTIADAGGITVTGTSVAFNGTEIGILTPTATTLSIALDADATDAAVEALAQAVRFANTSESPGTAARTVTFRLTDGGGTDNGGADTASFTRQVAVVSVNDAPAGADNGAAVLDTAMRTFTLADFGFSDVDGNGFASVRITTLPTTGTLSLRYVEDDLSEFRPVAAGDSISVQQIADGDLVFDPDDGTGNTATSFTFQVRDDGGTANGGVDLDQSPSTFTLTITQSNRAPLVDLNADTDGTDDSGSYLENGFAAGLGDNIVVADVDGDLIRGATVTITDASADDDLYIATSRNVSLPAGITLEDRSTSTTLYLTGAASAADYQAALRLIRFANDGDDPTAGGSNPDRIITVIVSDGTVNSAPATLRLTVVAVNDAPQNRTPDAQTGMEDTDLVFSAARGNAISIVDPDSSDGLVTTTLHVEHGTLKLAGWAFRVDVTGDGTDTLTLTGTVGAITAQLDMLTYRGVLNYSGIETLTVTTSDNGQTGTGGALTDIDTVAITLVPDNAITGSAGNDTLTGTPQPDYFNFSQGGDDTATGLEGDDAFFFGATLTAADRIDGGAGMDQVGISGDYTGATALTLGATTLTNVELLAALPGYDYEIITDDATVGTGQVFTLFAGNLAAEDNLIFNGAAETDGSFRVYGGLGRDLLTGGAGSDGFYFGPGKFDAASDTVNGGSGTNDQLALDGDYAITFSGDRVSNIEVIALLDGRLGIRNSYTISTDDSLLTGGATMTIFGAQLFNGFTFNGAAETDGRFVVFGGMGGDTIVGGAGDDLIYGGLGADTLTGGGGRNTFRYDAAGETSAAGRDSIVDFKAGDLLDLSRMDANEGTPSDDPFRFIGSDAFHRVAGELRFQQLDATTVFVEGDLDGDGVGDFGVTVHIVDSHVITQADFIL